MRVDSSPCERGFEDIVDIPRKRVKKDEDIICFEVIFSFVQPAMNYLRIKLNDGLNNNCYLIIKFSLSKASSFGIQDGVGNFSEKPNIFYTQKKVG